MSKLVNYFIIAIALLTQSICYAQSYDVPSQQHLQLSLQEAILLAVRENPNVRSSKLDLVLQKFNVYVQEWAFYPHFGFQAVASTGRTGLPGQPITTNNGYNISPSVSVTTPVGTSLVLTSNNGRHDGHFNPSLSLQVSQPLLRGFGRPIVEQALMDARDSETITRLSIEGVLRSTVSGVVNAYLDVLSAQKRISISEDALKRAERSVDETRLFIKAGRKAGNELITVEANVATAKTNLETDKNNYTQARYALLAAIGLDPNTPVTFVSLNLTSLINKYHLPTMAETKDLTLENDIQYQTDQITLNGSTKRNVIKAEDNTRWQLDFNANVTTGGGSGGGQNAGINSLFNGANQSEGMGLTLQIPIDDQLSKQALMSAQIALKKARLALMKSKWVKETNAINSWNTVNSAKESLEFAEDAQTLQAKTYSVSYQKYLHGLIDSLELQSAQVSLIQSQQTLLTNKINYIKSLVTLDELIGNTLKTWHVNVRY